MDFYDWTEIRRLASLQSEMAYYESFRRREFWRNQIVRKRQRGVIHAAAEFACLRTKRKSPVLGMFCGFIGLRTSGNIIEVVSSMKQITDCLYKITTEKR